MRNLPGPVKVIFFFSSICRLLYCLLYSWAPLVSARPASETDLLWEQNLRFHSGAESASQEISVPVNTEKLSFKPGALQDLSTWCSTNKIHGNVENRNINNVLSNRGQWKKNSMKSRYWALASSLAVQKLAANTDRNPFTELSDIRSLKGWKASFQGQQGRGREKFWIPWTCVPWKMWSSKYKCAFPPHVLNAKSTLESTLQFF